MNEHVDDLTVRCPVLNALRADIEAAFQDLCDCFSAGGKLLLCGNGGSAADCDHWSAELMKGFKQMRPLPIDRRAMLPPVLADRLQQGLPAIPLTAFTALQSAFANDVHADFGFAQLVHVLGRPGDMLVAISTSGNATNVRHAVTVARAGGLRTLALTGRSGGQLAPMVDRALCMPEDETFRIQELHLPVYHTLSLMLEDHFFQCPTPPHAHDTHTTNGAV